MDQRVGWSVHPGTVESGFEVGVRVCSNEGSMAARCEDDVKQSGNRLLSSWKNNTQATCVSAFFHVVGRSTPGGARTCTVAPKEWPCLAAGAIYEDNSAMTHMWW